MALQFRQQCCRPGAEFHVEYEDQHKVDFPDNTISPSTKHETAGGWDLTWSYKNLLGNQIAMVMPEKPQSGPLAGKISFFAPVSLFPSSSCSSSLRCGHRTASDELLFRHRLLLPSLRLHGRPHRSTPPSRFLGRFSVPGQLFAAGDWMRFASREAAVAQFVYLVLFSYAFFLKGFTGLAITIGSVVTLFVVMQVTGRIRWAEKFAVKPTPEPASQGS
jgi:hypothetical protein